MPDQIAPEYKEADRHTGSNQENTERARAGVTGHNVRTRLPPQPPVSRDALDPPDQSKNAYSRDVLKGILISLAAVFVKASARLIACSAKACI